MTDQRLVTGQPVDNDLRFDSSLRPRNLDDYVGQPQVVANLRVAIEAARSRGDALDHVLFFGPPGVGKTSLAHVMAAELDVPIKTTSGPVIERAGDLPPCSRLWSRARSCSSTRSTVSTPRSRRSSTRPWRTTASTSSWAPDPALAT